MTAWTAAGLRSFEESIRRAYEDGKAKGALHLGGGNEDQLIEIFKDIKRTDYVFSTYRSHFHALLHGIPEDWLRAEILAGRSISINSAQHRFFTSSIVGGCLPIAVGTALAISREAVYDDEPDHVWCFVGDMAASCGMFRDCVNYAEANKLPIDFIVEDNGMSTNTPTVQAWGARIPDGFRRNVSRYHFVRTYPHSGFKL